MRNGLKNCPRLALIAPLSFAGSVLPSEHIEACDSRLQEIGKGEQLPVDGYRQGH